MVQPLYAYDASHSPDRILYKSLARLPLGLCRLLCGLVGFCIYATDYKAFRTSILPVVSIGLQESARVRRQVTLAAAVALVRHTADVAFIRYASRDRLTSRLRFLRFADEDRLARDLAGSASGAIVISSNFCCFYYGLITPWTRHPAPDLVIVQPAEAARSANSQALIDRLAEVSGKRIRSLESGTLAAGRQMITALRKGELVSCLIDYNPPNLNSFAITTLLGRPSSHNSAIASIAALTGSPIIPCFTFFRDGRFVTEAGAPIHCESARAEDVMACCQAIDDRLTAVVARHPGQWAAWHTVARKWSIADQLTESLEPPDGVVAQG